MGRIEHTAIAITRPPLYIEKEDWVKGVAQAAIQYAKESNDTSPVMRNGIIRMAGQMAAERPDDTLLDVGLIEDDDNNKYSLEYREDLNIIFIVYLEEDTPPPPHYEVTNAWVESLCDADERWRLNRQGIGDFDIN